MASASGPARSETSSTDGRERAWSGGRDRPTGAAVTRLTDEAAWVGDERHDHAFSIAGIGVTPRTELAEAAGLAVDDGILTDADHRTSHPSVWAAGDVARIDGRRIEHWHAAREGGERAALSMLGKPLPPPRAPWVFSEVAGDLIDVVGWAPTWEETIKRGKGDRFCGGLPRRGLRHPARGRQRRDPGRGRQGIRRAAAASPRAARAGIGNGHGRGRNPGRGIGAYQRASSARIVSRAARARRRCHCRPFPPDRRVAGSRGRPGPSPGHAIHRLGGVRVRRTANATASLFTSSACRDTFAKVSQARW